MNKATFISLLMACALWAQSDIPNTGLTGDKPRNPGIVTTVASRAKLGDAGVVTVRYYRSNAMTRRYLALELSKELGPVRSWGIEKGGVRVLSLAPSTALRIQVESTDQSVAAFDDIAKSPVDYSFAVETMEGATLRATLRPVTRAVVMAVMRPTDEVPKLENLQASATGAVIAEVTRDGSGQLETASLRFDVNFDFDDAAVLTGMHVHRGLPGQNGPVVLDSGLRMAEGNPPLVSRASAQLTAEMDLTSPDVSEAVGALLADPSNYYLNLHTAANPGGAVRGQLRATEVAQYQIGCSLKKASGFNFLAFDALRTYYLMRNPKGGLDGAVNSRVALWNNFPVGYFLAGELRVNTGFGNGATELTDTADKKLVDGSVQKTLRTFDAGLDVFGSDGGFSLAPETYACQSKEQGYASDTEGGGPLRITSATSGADFVTTALAPGGLMTIKGTFLRSPSSNPSSVVNQSWPLEANGMEVTIGDEKTRGCTSTAGEPPADCRMPIGYLDQGQINVQVPVNTPPGKHPLRVWNRAIGQIIYSTQNTFEVEVLAAAPAIFGTSSAPTIYGANGALVGGTNAARAGDVLTIYAAGLGQTNPASVTGRPAAEAAATVTSVTVLFGTGTVSQLAQTAEVVPGLVGVYTVRVTVPTGAGTGPQSLRLRMGTRESRPVTIPML